MNFETEYFFNLLLEASTDLIHKFEQLKWQLKQIIGIQLPAGKVRKCSY